MSRGFITVATGWDRYYILAHNLLVSYKYHCPDPMPFAIICDRHNEWTEDFDQVVLMDNPVYSFADKMRIIDLSPFDETIFIDADCLAYRDLNGLWDIFKESPDFGILGYVHEEEMWWKKENLGELKDKVHFNLTCQGGIYYVRNNGKDIKTFLDMFSFIKERYPDYKFEFSPKVVMDENLAVLTYSVLGLVPVRGWKDFFAYYPMIKSLDLDIRTGTLACEYSGFPGEVYKDLYLLHWGTKATVTEWLYNREVFRLRERPLKGSELARLVFIRFRCMAIKIWWRIKPLVPQKIIDMIFKGGRFAGITPLSEK